MKKGRFESSASAKKHTKKVVALLLVMLLLVGSVVGTTLAWLTAKTTTITNTFTVGSISLSLAETDNVYKMTPGAVLPKDPTVTVTKGSEDCWVFVKVVESNDTAGNVNYTVDNTKWTELGGGYAGIYYAKVSSLSAADNVVLPVLAGNQVTISNSMTKEYADSITGGAAAPTLAFTAYAIQQAGLDYGEAADDTAKAVVAWTELLTVYPQGA